ncbi:MAG: hypothetical protein CMH30_06750 [Micavibrio sp.]|nr:hypothetical protein [Micavibrio sp.]
MHYLGLYYIVLWEVNMIKANWTNFLKRVANDDTPSKRRKFVRRENDVCVIEFNGKHYPIKDWSMGGALIETTDRSISVNDTVNFRIKFKLKDRVVDVEHTGRIARKTKTHIALEFDQLPGQTRTAFDTVVKESTGA